MTEGFPKKSDTEDQVCATKQANHTFVDLVEFGENPNGLRAELPEDVSHGGCGRDFFQQYNFDQNIAGPRWGGDQAFVQGAGIPIGPRVRRNK